jgi:hypothetical protein
MQKNNILCFCNIQFDGVVKWKVKKLYEDSLYMLSIISAQIAVRVLAHKYWIIGWIMIRIMYSLEVETDNMLGQ